MYVYLVKINLPNDINHFVVTRIMYIFSVIHFISRAIVENNTPCTTG